MAIEVFNRYENKFLLDASAAEVIGRYLSGYMEPDEYNRTHEFYTISNLYYDTDDNFLIRNSLSKPKYKEKLRLRAYGVPTLDDKVYLEIKKKFCGLVNKRRTTLSLSDAYQFVETGQRPEFKEYMNKQVVNEIEYFLKIYSVTPKVYIAYDRRAFFCRENRDLRITFDTNIRTRRVDLNLESGDYGDPLLEENACLMEVKAANSLPVWLVHMLSEMNVYKTSFSKYGTEYQRTMIRDVHVKGELKPCLTPCSDLQLVPRYQ